MKKYETGAEKREIAGPASPPIKHYEKWPATDRFRQRETFETKEQAKDFQTLVAALNDVDRNPSPVDKIPSGDDKNGHQSHGTQNSSHNFATEWWKDPMKNRRPFRE